MLLSISYELVAYHLISSNLLESCVFCPAMVIQHIYQYVDKANKMCNIILNNITDVVVCTLVNLYKCYVRLLLD